MSATGFGICGQKNSYSSTTKCGNWVEDRCGKRQHNRPLVDTQPHTPLAVRTSLVFKHSERRVDVLAHMVSNNLPVSTMLATTAAVTHNTFSAARRVYRTSDAGTGVRAHNNIDRQRAIWLVNSTLYSANSFPQ